MEDTLIVVPRSALEEALFNVGLKLTATEPSKLAQMRAAMQITTVVMEALEPVIQAHARSAAARHAAMSKHYGQAPAQQSGGLNDPTAQQQQAPQTAQNEAGAAISPGPLPAPVVKRRGRPPVAPAAPLAPLNVPDSGLTPAAHGPMMPQAPTFAPTAMPTQPFAPMPAASAPAAPAAAAAPVPPVVVEYPATPAQPFGA